METVVCPLCSSKEYIAWATENGYNCVRCSRCRLLYVNPRPSTDSIDIAVQLGGHQFEDGTILNTKTRRIPAKQQHSEDVVRFMFADILARKLPLAWLDVGAGYGEFVAALLRALPAGSEVHGLEPMPHKVNNAISKKLPVRQGYLNDVSEIYQVVSFIDVFSHIADFSAFLVDVKKVLNGQGEILLKTGNAADIGHRCNFPGPLNLPDHLVFAGVTQLARFLENAGFGVVAVKAERIDGFWYSMKNAVKWLLGHPVSLTLPYSSPTRTIWIRARLN